MSNKDLLKQAIAEAKTIREAAIANAKEALEETLTPHLKDMLAAKLQEMEEKEDEEVMDENIYEAEEEEVEAEEGEEAEEEGAEEESEEGEEEVEIEDMSIEDLKDLIRDIVSQEVGHDESEEELTGMETPEGEEDMVSMDGDSEEIDINELLAELAQEDTLSEGFEEWLDRVSAQMDKFGKENPAIQAIERAIAAAQEKAKKAGLTGHGMTKGHKISEESEDLAEALATVEALRGQLQEVNLLNAKLLYVNKVFKSNNLSEGQKVNVIAAFDKAETVKEVKLVFETVSKNVVAKPATIKEHRSFASKATGNAQTTAPKEILSEVSEQVSRWQKLAGIIK
jgi:hypothetical protein